MTQTEKSPAPIGSTAIWFGVGRKAAAPVDAAGILFRYTDADGTWLLLTQRAYFLTKPGTWATPGGSIDPGELPLEAAMRELDEELGVKASSLTGATIAKVIENKSATRTYTTFVVDVPSDDIQVPTRLPRETADVMWVLQEECYDMPLHQGFKDVLANL